MGVNRKRTGAVSLNTIVARGCASIPLDGIQRGLECLACDVRMKAL